MNYLLRICLALFPLSLIGHQVCSQIMADTLVPPGLQSCPELFSWVAETGPIMGNNSFEDREKAQLLRTPAYGNGFVTAAVVYWDFVVLGNNGRVKLKAYSVGADGKPNNLLAVSDSIDVASIDTATGFDVFPFTAPAAFSNEVFLSVDLSSLADGDTVNILATAEDCSDRCGAYEFWNIGIWNKICDTYDIRKVDMAIKAVVEWTPTSVTEPAPALLSFGPNPAADYLDFEPESSGIYRWDVLDGLGRVRLSGKGQSRTRIDLTQLSEGWYLLRWHSEGESAKRGSRRFLRR